MRILFISNLFPSEDEPYRGIMNARLAHQLAHVCGNLHVLSPRAALPFEKKTFKARPDDLALVPQFPKVPYVPKVGGLFNDGLMEKALRTSVTELHEKLRFEAIVSAWMFPDGVAAARIAQDLDLPVILTAQGSDVHQYLKSKPRRAKIIDAVDSTFATVTRSRDLALQLEEAGAPKNKLHTIYNGIDHGRFKPGDTGYEREMLGLPGDVPVLLFVGNLLPVKNPQLLMDAHALLCKKRNLKPELVIIGEGPLRETLEKRGQRHVVFLGGRKPEFIAQYMRAADVLCIPSQNEGVPNVMLEALSTGLPVAATPVGGIPEIIDRQTVGTLAEKATPEAFADAIEKVLSRMRNSTKIRERVDAFTWKATAEGYHHLIKSAVAAKGK